MSTLPSDEHIAAWIEAGMPLFWASEAATDDPGVTLREDDLFRLGCAMRRHGAPAAAIEAALLAMNAEHDGPQLAEALLRRTALNAARYHPAEPVTEGRPPRRGPALAGRAR